MTEKFHFDDLTKITCPTGMLDDDTFQRLEAWSHGHELWDGCKWVIVVEPYRYGRFTIRAKPAPVKRVRWSNVYLTKITGHYTSREVADALREAGRIAVYRVEWDETGHSEWFREEV